MVDFIGAPVIAAIYSNNGQVDGGNPLPVSSASGAGGSNTGTVTSVPSSAASVTILASNTGRFGATVTNTDANPLKLLLSATGNASATNYTVNITTGGYYEVPYGYTGQIKGIWDVDGAGVALVTEFTA